MAKADESGALEGGVEAPGAQMPKRRRAWVIMRVRERVLTASAERGERCVDTGGWIVWPHACGEEEGVRLRTVHAGTRLGWRAGRGRSRHEPRGGVAGCG